MIRLHINVDHVATLRNQRGTPYPDPVEAARMCASAGASGITMHLREDRRHIVDDDVRRLRALDFTPLNLEMAATDEMAELAREVRPHAITLVPERREERTTEGGLELGAAQAKIERVRQVAELVGSRLSLFVEPSETVVRESARLGARQVEFHTGHYASAEPGERARLLVEFAAACRLAHELGLEVAAGHGLTTENVGPIAALPFMAELNIGHAVVSDAVFVGLDRAVRAFLVAIQKPT